jgi:hypothetical protein
MVAGLMDGFRLTTGPEIFLFALGFGLISRLPNGHRTVLRWEKLLDISHTAQFLNAWSTEYCTPTNALILYHILV